ncbi:pyridoxal phosphate-dependent aminotransferase [Yersinia mollaretii]|uniref:pyridoxal phosphate-dependent aminotransferase n=1 Tax=Yersinia mollaretii TaxID=33060 RepID=UPI001427D538|nr:pyridoxal phosphate-dependent aminotransferase [Yersinia mollaretii]MDA5537415.1 pyridoxal phosphate-dependent aminotransferase [Yersinia mollaretii]NIL05317.1 pyridoxal phosphate-dependent aminotransferase [Yersinia mollaretii]
MKPMTDPTPNDVFTRLKTMVERYRPRADMPDFAGSALLDLSIGNPDLAPELRWRQRLQYFVSRDDLHGYGEFRPDINRHLRQRFAAYYQRRFLPSDAPVLLDPERHVVDLLGSKEGIFYSLLACLAPGEAVLMADPSYAVYQSCAQLIGARVELFTCDERGQPQLGSLRAEQLAGARVLVICSPNNPTGVELSPGKLREVLDFAQRHDLWVVIDRAYAEISFELQSNGTLGGAALPEPGALSRVLELHSLSKSCGIAGWRIGFAAGAPQLVEKIRAAKFNTDFGTFLPLQCVAAEMLDELETIAARNSTIYAARMRRFVAGAASFGWDIPPSQGTFFLWAPLPPGFAGDDLQFVEALFEETGVLLAPGSGFGPGGAGRVRIALVQSDKILDEALQRLHKWRVSCHPDRINPVLPH